MNDAEKRNGAERAIHNHVPYASSITGIPGRHVERVSIRDVEIGILGGFPPGTEEDARRVVPENSAQYPENRVSGVLPAHAFYIRHARDLRLSDVRVTLRQPDARPAFALDDVHDSAFKRVTARGVSSSAPFQVGANCANVKIEPPRR